MMVPFMPLLLLLVSFWPLTATGETPACTASASGTVACIVDRSCICRFERGGSTTDQPSGYRWDCGILRPYCSRAPQAEPTERSIDEFNLLIRPPSLLPRQRPPLRPRGEIAG